MSDYAQVDDTEVIVSAAQRTQCGLIIPSVRHCDRFLYEIMKRIPDAKHPIIDQGFVTNKYRYLTREEALELAQSNGQLKRDKAGNIYDRLFSENLY